MVDLAAVVPWERKLLVDLALVATVTFLLMATAATGSLSAVVDCRKLGFANRA